MIAGAIPYRTFKERLSIINSLKDEFNYKVQIRIDDGLVIYTHRTKEKDGTIYS